MYSFFTTEAEVHRLLDVNGKSNYSATGDVFEWYLKPLSLADWIEERAFGKQYKYTTDVDNDIKENDKLIIDSETYTVKGVSKFKGLQEIFYLQCLISKW